MSVWINKCRSVEKNSQSLNKVTADFSPLIYSGIYKGLVTHHYLKPYKNNTQLEIYALVLDLDELPLFEHGHLFNWQKWAFLRFKATDHLQSEPEINDGSINNIERNNTKNSSERIEIEALKKRVLTKLDSLLHGKFANHPTEKIRKCDRVIFAGQCRHFGFLYSPVSLFFCYSQNTPQYLLIEVKQTKLTEKKYFVIDLQKRHGKHTEVNDKPLVDIDMTYKWHISPLENNLSLGVETYQVSQIFSMWLNLERFELNTSNLKSMLNQFPFAPFKLSFAIYRQFLKRYFHRSSTKE